MNGTNNNRRTRANPGMFAGDDEAADSNATSSMYEDTTVIDTQTVLDKQLEIIKEGNAFLEDFKVLMAEAKQVHRNLSILLDSATSVKVGIREEDIKTMKGQVAALIKSVNIATTGCKTAVTSISDNTKEAIKCTYTNIGNDMKASVKTYADRCIKDAEDAMEKKYDQLEVKLNGHFIPNASYYLHLILLVLSFTFGVFGAYTLFPTVLTAVMGWTMVAIVGVAVLILLMVRLSNL